ncbi:unnamed protein product [Ceratitis capitata]|uniref:(Mediterranean fruit fly) hypothetical protein n=1 Tax=Ceratitis capitata TaxID=7213 RepID=A0A811UGA0_CERCA|nr:unnamed protein product [Ceratitis capitata]
MQISENLLRVIFMLSTIVAVTDCCSSRLLLLKEHTLQIVQQHRLHNAHIDDYDYEHEDYEHLQQQQHEQQHLEQQHQLQQQKMPQYVDIVSSGIEFLKNLTNEYARFRDEKPEQEENTTETQLIGGTMDLEDFGGDSFQSLLGIFDAAAFETTTARTTTTTTTTRTTATSVATGTTTVTDSTSTSTSTGQTSISTTTTTTRFFQESSKPASVTSTTQSASTESMEPRSTHSTTTTTTVPTIDKDGMNDLKIVPDLLSLPCSGQFNTEFCLNRGRCFRYPIGNDTIHSCVCADGYIGERCESKSMNGSFIPSIGGAGKKQKILMARIVFSFPMLLALSVIYIMIGAAIVFKRPTTPPTALTTKDPFELLADDDAGELIVMNSFPIAEPVISYSTLTD